MSSVLKLYICSIIKNSSAFVYILQLQILFQSHIVLWMVLQILDYPTLLNIFKDHQVTVDSFEIKFVQPLHCPKFSVYSNANHIQSIIASNSFKDMIE